MRRNPFRIKVVHSDVMKAGGEDGAAQRTITGACIHDAAGRHCVELLRFCLARRGEESNDVDDQFGAVCGEGMDVTSGAEGEDSETGRDWCRSARLAWKPAGVRIVWRARG